MANQYIKLEDAIDIVMDLANDALEVIESNGLETMADRDKKQAAIDTVHDFFVNNVFD